MNNAYEVRGDITAIFLKSPKYGDTETIISTSKLELAMLLPTSWSLRLSTNKSFYCNGKLTISPIQKTIIFHRWITNCPEGYVVDHINHNTLDNRDENLRIITSGENGQNRKGAPRNNNSGIRGVCWQRNMNKWYGKCTAKGKFYYTKYYEDKFDAERELIEMRRKLMPYSTLDQITG